MELVDWGYDSPTREHSSDQTRPQSGELPDALLWDEYEIDCVKTQQQGMLKLPPPAPEHMARLLGEVERLQRQHADLLCDIDFLQAEARFAEAAHEARLAAQSRQIRLLCLATTASAVVIQHLWSHTDPQLPTKRLLSASPTPENTMEDALQALGFERVAPGATTRDPNGSMDNLKRLRAQRADMSQSMEELVSKRDSLALHALLSLDSDVTDTTTDLKPSSCWSIIISIQLTLMITLAIFGGYSYLLNYQ
ncbi:hypothetical protein B0H14DRAFT_2828610 [Mycena olivaceomarginata]|nr:hypothetical protein B0H14DRAFT_2828610 [Mycena olivaceomarginata]